MEKKFKNHSHLKVIKDVLKIFFFSFEPKQYYICIIYKLDKINFLRKKKKKM